MNSNEIKELEKLLEKKSKELDEKRIELDDIENVLFLLQVWATPSVPLQFVNQDLSSKRDAAAVTIDELEIEIEELKTYIENEVADYER